MSKTWTVRAFLVYILKTKEVCLASKGQFTYLHLQGLNFIILVVCHLIVFLFSVCFLPVYLLCLSHTHAFTCSETFKLLKSYSLIKLNSIPINQSLIY